MMASSSVSSILDGIAAAGRSFGENEAGSREALIEYSRSLVAALEIPSEFIQRTRYVSQHSYCCGRQAFPAPERSGWRRASALSEKAGVDVALLERLTRHLVAMYLITYHDGAFHATTLSNGLAEENYQHSISFCYDAARPSFNGFPEFFKKTQYRSPSLGSLEGPFQDAHKTQLPFFEWLVATLLHLQHFDSFMSAYRAGKANWYDPGFYPVSERMISGFDGSSSDVLLVDVGGGRGHDVAAFAAQHVSRMGRIILQDREPVIADVLASGKERLFEAQVHDFFTPQPIKGARAYSLHSILHD
ncbi:hypothetical protein V501_08932 [Pseudogymnoascus sp. VKM F-4519 (FW-2642)]|nr:hypothetical protein V501_08932 [Pseudogymnoascus sp. VKM F-4519 (FW-2642)]